MCDIFSNKVLTFGIWEAAKGLIIAYIVLESSGIFWQATVKDPCLALGSFFKDSLQFFQE